MGCVALPTGHGPSGFLLPLGTWYLRFQIRFLEVPGQHHCLRGFARVGRSVRLGTFLAMYEASVCQVNNAHFSNI